MIPTDTDSINEISSSCQCYTISIHLIQYSLIHTKEIFHKKPEFHHEYHASILISLITSQYIVLASLSAHLKLRTYKSLLPFVSWYYKNDGFVNSKIIYWLYSNTLSIILSNEIISLSLWNYLCQWAPAACPGFLLVTFGTVGALTSFEFSQ